MKSLSTTLSVLFLGACLGMSSGCTSSAPRSFSQTLAPSWASVELREGIDYENAWDTVMDLVVSSFDIDMALKEDGYLRTQWLYTWSGEYKEDYRVRLAVKFSPDRKTLRFRTEANYSQAGKRTIGTDTRLLSTLKTDLMGTVGRTTR